MVSFLFNFEHVDFKVDKQAYQNLTGLRFNPCNFAIKITYKNLHWTYFISESFARAASERKMKKKLARV